MLKMARIYQGPKGKRFEQGDIETWGKDDEFEAASIAFVTHEMPEKNRRAVLENAVRITTDMVLVVDISPSYTASEYMLEGEPYMPNYLAGIEDDVEFVARSTGRKLAREILVPGRAHAWILSTHDRPSGTRNTADRSSEYMSAKQTF
jgi:hypothetical protein